MEVRDFEPSDYDHGPAFTKEFSLVGKDKKKEKIRVMHTPSIFNKNIKVVSEKSYVTRLWYKHEQIKFLVGPI